MNINEQLIDYLANKWDKEKDVQEIVFAIVAELKQDKRKAQRNYHYSDEDEAYWDNLIESVQEQEFWQKMDHLLHFSFDY